jgi:uncharacterized membrane protein YbhN (UPF0104 family)
MPDESETDRAARPLYSRLLRPRHLIALAVAVGTAAGFFVVAKQMGASVVEAATTPSWGYLVGAFAAWIVIQPLRALLWKLTLRQPVEFRAIYAASAVGSFLDTIVPGRLGEVSKLGILRVAAGPSWPGLPVAGGSLLCKHLLDGIAFALVGAAAAFFLPIPMWGRLTLVAVAVLAAAAMAGSGSLHRRVGHRLPPSVDTFFAQATAPRGVLVRGAVVALATWLVKWAAVFCLLQAVGVEATLGTAMLYLLMTALAGVAPLLPGNAGLYQGAAVGALAAVGQAGANAVAASLLAPAVGSVAAATAALVAFLWYGRHFAAIPRAALQRA